MGLLTHIVQPLDTKFNHLLKAAIDKGTQKAASNPKLKKYFVTSTGKVKAGSQYVTYKVQGRTKPFHVEVVCKITFKVNAGGITMGWLDPEPTEVCSRKGCVLLG